MRRNTLRQVNHSSSMRNAGLTPGSKQFLERESSRNRTPRIVRMHDRERDRDRPRPRRHLVDDLAQQHQLGRNRRDMLARVKIEQAEVDLDVAVGRLDSAARQNAFPRPREARIVCAQPRQLQRAVRLDAWR